MDPLVTRQYGDSDPLRVRIETHLKYSERQENLDEVCRGLMALSGDEEILEVGFGRGTFLRTLREHGHRGRLIGVDQSPTMVAEARAASKGMEPEIEWRIGRADTLHFTGGTFDWLVARHMLYHVPDIPEALREFKRVTKPEGRLLFSTNSGHSLPLLLGLCDDVLKAFDMPQRRPSTLTFSIENARETLEAEGFGVEEHIFENALVFPSPEPLLAYVVTLSPFLDLSQDDPALWTEMETWLQREVECRIEKRGGVWRDPKNVGIYVCRRVPS